MGTYCTSAFYLNTLVICSVLRLNSAVSDVFEFKPGYTLAGNILITTQITKSWEECREACLARSKCLSVEMHMRFRLCKIFATDTSSVGVELKRSLGTWFSEKKVWTKKTIDQRCVDDCSTSETCFIRGSLVCERTECGAPPSLDNSSVILGTETSVESSILYTCPDEPDESLGSVSVCGRDGQWSLKNFTCQKAFVCPQGWEMFKESCYLFENSKKTFTGAENFCIGYGARLVHVESAEENTFLHSYLGTVYPIDDYWIGMTDEITETQWKWYGTDVAVNFDDWHPGEATYRTDENCAVFGDTLNYRWADVRCSSQRRIICELTN